MKSTACTLDNTHPSEICVMLPVPVEEWHSFLVTLQHIYISPGIRKRIKRSQEPAMQVCPGAGLFSSRARERK